MKLNSRKKGDISLSPRAFAEILMIMLLLIVFANYIGTIRSQSIYYEQAYARDLAMTLSVLSMSPYTLEYYSRPNPSIASVHVEDSLISITNENDVLIRYPYFQNEHLIHSLHSNLASPVFYRTPEHFYQLDSGLDFKHTCNDILKIEEIFVQLDSLDQTERLYLLFQELAKNPQFSLYDSTRTPSFLLHILQLDSSSTTQDKIMLYYPYLDDKSKNYACVLKSYFYSKGIKAFVIPSSLSQFDTKGAFPQVALGFAKIPEEDLLFSLSEVVS